MPCGKDPYWKYVRRRGKGSRAISEAGASQVACNPEKRAAGEIVSGNPIPVGQFLSACYVRQISTPGGLFPDNVINTIETGPYR